MSLFEDLINAKIKELEDLKKNLLIDVETKIRKEAEAVVNKSLERIATVESETLLEREKILYDAVVESRKMIAETYESLLQDLINSIYDEIERMRGSERYINFLSRLLENAVTYVQSKEVVIYASPKDRGVVETLARKLGLSGLIAERDMKGGVVVASKDGSIVVDYSIESIIANKVEEIKHLLYEMTYER